MATDLHAAIRTRLAEQPILAAFEARRATEVNAWASAARGALAALLDWHAVGYRYYEEPGKPPNWCHACNDIGSCETVQIIARELGIKT